MAEESARNPGDSAERAYLEFVRPTVLEFLEHWEDVRLGRLAAIVLSHMVDHFYVARIDPSASRHGLRAFRDDLVARDSDFALIEAVCDASKHALLTSRGARPINSGDQISSQSLGWGEGRWGEFRWDGSPQVVVELNDGTKRALEGPVRKQLDFWRTKLDL